MDAPTPSTKPPSALDLVHAARLSNHVKRSIEDMLAPFDPMYGSSLPDLLVSDTRKHVQAMVEYYLDEVKRLKAIQGYKVGGMRREVFKDIYRRPEDRATAIKVVWRARKTKERLQWEEGEHLTEEQYLEFGHLLDMQLWGMNDDLSGCVFLKKPSGYLMDIFFTPVEPVRFIYLDMEITKDGQVQLS